jgi:hypothetical protein
LPVAGQLLNVARRIGAGRSALDLGDPLGFTFFLGGQAIGLL